MPERDAYSIHQDAINAIRMVGEKGVSVIVSWGEGQLAPRHVAFELSGTEAAALMNAVHNRSAKGSDGEVPSPDPSADLKRAIEEARSLKGRFNAAEGLFNALETEGQR